jgi:hypothetical protein
VSDNAQVAAAVAEGAAPNAEYVAKMTSATLAEPAPKTAEEASAVARPDHIPEKFWDAQTGKVRVDDVLKSYNELERKLREGKPAEQNAEKPNEDADPKKLTLERKPEEKADGDNPVASALEAAGLSFKDIDAEYQQNGDVSAETRTKLEAAFGADVVKTYFDGLKALEATIMLQAHEAAGGKDAFDAAMKWGMEQLSDADLESYNKLVSDPSTQRQGIEWLVSKFKAANPSEGSLVVGEARPGPGDVFNSREEMVTAMRDPNYARDPAYRQRVAEKLQRSVKAGTISTNISTHTQRL